MQSRQRAVEAGDRFVQPDCAVASVQAGQRVTVMLVIVAAPSGLSRASVHST